MPIKFIGRTTDLRGKRLFDILARLKDFGVGRIIYRNQFMDRYAPAPSYYVVTKVDPDMKDPTEAEIDILPKGKTIVWGMKVWRGEPLGEQPITRLHKNDWKLVPRIDEAKFLSYSASIPKLSIVPDSISFPPLFEHLILEEKLRNGLPMSRPMLKVEICENNRGSMYKTESELMGDLDL